MSRHGMPRRTARCAFYTGKPGWVQEAFFRHVRGSGAGWCDPTWPRLPCDLWSCLSLRRLITRGQRRKREPTYIVFLKGLANKKRKARAAL
jgi:hypothetical protein